MIPIQDWQTLDAIDPNFDQLWQLCDTYQTTGFYPFTLQCRSSQFDAEARQFPKRAGYNEDSATGVAASALAAYLTRSCPQQEQPQAAVRQFSIGQGYAMGKPSRIFAQIHLQNGEISRVQVGGSAVIGTSETLYL
jgi:PhzF family phenazine biosynthesis protein